MRGLRAALQFLTILPLGKARDFPAREMTPYFPLAGFVVGLLLAVTDTFFQFFFPLYIVSFLDVVFLAVISGAIHLDGVADTADGLFSHRPLDDVLKIMKDSRVGTMGVLALILVLGMKWAGLSSMGESRTVYLIIVPAYS